MEYIIVEAVIIDTARLLHFRNHGGQAYATIESIASDGSHGIANGHGGQAGATRESTPSDGCYGENYNSLEIISLPRFEW